jgi:hypothetical protein
MEEKIDLLLKSVEILVRELYYQSDDNDLDKELSPLLNEIQNHTRR